MEQLDISPLRKNFCSTGAKDTPYFWIHGASNFIPNILKLIEHTHKTPLVVDIATLENDKSDYLKNMFIKYGSDKNFHNYHILYSSIIDPTKKMDIMEIGLGTRNPTIPSTMYFYEQEAQFINTPGASLRAFKEFCPLSNIYGADIDREILFTEERIETFFVDQSDIESLNSLFKNRMFDIIIDDGLHHISSNMNTLLATLEHVNIDGYIIIEDIDFVDIWYAVDFIMSQIPKFETKIIDCKNGKCPYIYLIKRKY